jgi:predicted P-loop ATPase
MRQQGREKQCVSTLLNPQHSITDVYQRVISMQREAARSHTQRERERERRMTRRRNLITNFESKHTRSKQASKKQQQTSPFESEELI